MVTRQVINDADAARLSIYKHIKLCSSVFIRSETIFEVRIGNYFSVISDLFLYVIVCIHE